MLSLFFPQCRTVRFVAGEPGAFRRRNNCADILRQVKRFNIRRRHRIRICAFDDQNKFAFCLLTVFAVALRRLRQRNQCAPEGVFVIPESEMFRYMEIFQPPSSEELLPL